MENKTKEKIVLDTCVVKDLISYIKTGQPICKSNIDYEKVLSYINNFEDSISKCYITIFSLYELLSSFDENNFNEDFEQLISLMPQTITSNYARKFVDDFDIMNLNEKTEQEQQAVIQNLRNLISDMYANYFADIFICLPIIFISILETTIEDKRKTFIKRLNNTIEALKQTIWHFIKNQYNELLIASKNDRIKLLDNILQKISQLCLCMLNGLSKLNKVTYRDLNKALIEFNICFKDKFNDIHVNKNIFIFDDLFVWFKNNTNVKSFISLTEEEKAKSFVKFIMDIIIKNTESQANRR
ncbi:MAG: hypothetical protein PHX62_00140 [Bacilli bacterium]|nr:hypothetical protein [Bacilli bacterium]